MLRLVSPAIAGLILIGGLALAADHRGYLKSVQPNKLILTVEEQAKEKDIEIKTDAATKFIGGTATIATGELNQMIKDSGGKGVRALVKSKGSGASEVATEVCVAARRDKGGKE